MRKGLMRYGIIVLGSLACLMSTLYTVTPVQAQHIDTFKLGPGGRGELAKRSRDPNAPESGTIKVEDRYSYEILLEKEKIDKGAIRITDVDLVELSPKDRGRYEWHQVRIFDELDIIQKHTRTVGKLECIRERNGVIYWAPNGVKYVAWHTWSGWNCKEGK